MGSTIINHPRPSADLASALRPTARTNTVVAVWAEGTHSGHYPSLMEGMASVYGLVSWVVHDDATSWSRWRGPNRNHCRREMVIYNRSTLLNLTFHPVSRPGE